jgi:SAM-dependent methyltransferase
MRLPFNARLMAERLSGRSVFDTRYYRESQRSRLLNLFAHVDLERWKGMRVLEVGAGLGHLGVVFEQLGFEVVSSDGRPEHVEAMRARGRDAVVMDLDRVGADDLRSFDLILAFGVLYHLARPEQFLKACGDSAPVLLLESAVCDSPEPVIRWVDEAGGWRGTDQALAGHGCRPSPAWVERTCAEAGYRSVVDISSPVGNWVIGSFDWEQRGTGDWRRDGINFRKMWVCEG